MHMYIKERQDIKTKVIDISISIDLSDMHIPI